MTQEQCAASHPRSTTKSMASIAITRRSFLTSPLCIRVVGSARVLVLLSLVADILSKKKSPLDHISVKTDSAEQQRDFPRLFAHLAFIGSLPVRPVTTPQSPRRLPFVHHMALIPRSFRLVTRRGLAEADYHLLEHSEAPLELRKGIGSYVQLSPRRGIFDVNAASK